MPPLADCHAAREGDTDGTGRGMNLLRGVLFGIAAMVMLALVLIGPRGFRAPSPQSAEINVITDAAPPRVERSGNVRARLEAALVAVPEYKGFAERLREAFPAEYDAALARGIERSEISARLDPPDQFVLDAVGALRRGRGRLAAVARDDALTNLFQAQGATLAALGETDSRLCVGFLYGSAGAGFASFAAAHRDIVAQLAQAGLDAVLDGPAAPVLRRAPSDADFSVIEHELTDRGLGRAEIEALLDGRMPDPPLPDARLCGAALAYLDVLKGLPLPSRMAIYALSVELMSRS